MTTKLAPGTATTALLDALSDGDIHAIDGLSQALKLTTRQVSNAASQLDRRGYLVRPGIGLYRLNDKGIAASQDGVSFKSGPNGPISKVPRRRDTFRQRVWASMRMRRSFTIGEVITDAARETDGDAYNNASRYWPSATSWVSPRGTHPRAWHSRHQQWLQEIHTRAQHRADSACLERRP